MNSLLASASDHPHLPAGLRVEEAVRIAEAITAAHAESTRTMYDWAWSQWERWCHARGATALPAEPALICAYLTERAAGGLSVGSIDLACGAIAYQHRRRGLADPILTEGVRQVRRGLRRIIGTPRAAARPDPSTPTTSARSSSTSTAAPSWASATPPSSCSASPRRCVAPSWLP